MALTRRSFTVSALALATAPARAESPYPAKPITMLIPYPPGSGSDVVGRIVANKMSQVLGQQLIADNRSGASGNIAMDIVRRAAPDGYTVILASVSFSINPATMPGVHYTASDFTPIAMVGRLPFTLMAAKSVAAKDIDGLAALAKSQPGQLNGGQGGTTGTTYFLLEAFKKAASIDVASIPYKGTSETVLDLLAGRLQLMFAPITTALPHYRTGEIKVLGVTGKERTALMPDVPTFIEAGFPTLDISTWFALVGPRGIPAPAVKALSDAAARAVDSADVKEALAKNGVMPSYAPPDQLASFMAADLMRWQELVKASGFKPQ
jgi:tripartite-type tricarboxylate transporter receptor subunit TctC